MPQDQELLRATIAPSNSIIFLSDPTCPIEVPEITRGASIWRSANCVAVGTLCEIDGATTIVLGSKVDGSLGRKVFTGSIQTPGRIIAVTTSTADIVLSLSVPDEKTTLNIWTNDESEPDLILIEAS